METKGFLTKSELSEARMIASLKSHTNWQKARLVRLYVKQTTGKRVEVRTTDDDWMGEWFNGSLSFFRSLSKA